MISRPSKESAIDTIRFYSIERSKDYELSRCGKVRSLKSGPRRFGKILADSVNEDGYHRVKIDNTYVGLHRLLAETFIPRAEGAQQVNHKDGNKGNNSLENLEWVTHEENLYHAMRTGLHARPNQHIIAVQLKDPTRGWVFRSQSDAERVLGIPQPNISRCLAGARWLAGGHVWSAA